MNEEGTGRSVGRALKTMVLKEWIEAALGVWPVCFRTRLAERPNTAW